MSGYRLVLKLSQSRFYVIIWLQFELFFSIRRKGPLMLNSIYNPTTTEGICDSYPPHQSVSLQFKMVLWGFVTGITSRHHLLSKLMHLCSGHHCNYQQMCRLQQTSSTHQSRMWMVWKDCFIPNCAQTIFDTYCTVPWIDSLRESWKQFMQSAGGYISSHVPPTS